VALPHAFYDRDVVEVARELLGCVISHGPCSGVIVETEAYHDSEPACHAYVGLTARTKLLFGPPGFAYVYRSYGIHAMLNAVSEAEGVGAAVLIRALEPLDGVAEMAARRGFEVADGAVSAPVLRALCSGPGKLTQALGVELTDNGCDLARGPIVFSERPAGWRDGFEVAVGRRIGITKAAELPWRFGVAGSRFLSVPFRDA
jgi:DNA-3-methyladenine glycosylase